MTLPAVPPDVGHFDLAFDVNGRTLRAGFWFLLPDLQSWTQPWLLSLVDQFVLYTLSGFTGVMHAGASLSTCRVSVAGSNPVEFVQHVAPNHGAYTGGQADAIASGVYLVASSGRRGSGSRLRVPGCPDDFIDDNWRLSNAGVSQLHTLANDLTDWARVQTGPTGLPLVLGTLQRRTSAGPLPAAQFDPAVMVVPSFRVEVLSRRLPKSRWVSSA